MKRIAVKTHYYDSERGVVPTLLSKDYFHAVFRMGYRMWLLKNHDMYGRADCFFKGESVAHWYDWICVMGIPTAVSANPDELKWDAKWQVQVKIPAEDIMRNLRAVTEYAVKNDLRHVDKIRNWSEGAEPDNVKFCDVRGEPISLI